MYLAALTRLGAADTAGLPVAPSAAQAGSIAQQRAAVQAGVSTALQKQRESVAAQLKSARPASGSSNSFFLLPALAQSLTPIPRLAPPRCEPLPNEKAESLMHEAAEREGLSIDLLRAVINQESGFRPCAVSPKGAMGLMQLMPSTSSQFGVNDPFDPRQNIDSGARLLKQLLTRYGGDVSLALGAYNAGAARVDAAGGVPAIEETLHYVQAILGNLPPH